MENQKIEQPTLTQKKIISPNLLPSEKKEILYLEIIGETVRKVCQIGLVFMSLFFIVGGLILLNIQKNEKAYTFKYENIDRQKLDELNKIKKEVQETNGIGNMLNQSIKKQYKWSDFLSNLSKITPEGVVLLSIETPLDNPTWITITGVARERDLFLKFKNGLDSSGFFTKIESPLSNYVDPLSLEFEINAQVKNWNPKWAEDAKKAKLSARKAANDATGE